MLLPEYYTELQFVFGFHKFPSEQEPFFYGIGNTTEVPKDPEALFKIISFVVSWVTITL